MRTTNQKIKILEYLKSVKSHPTAYQVYLEVKKVLPQITLATVYRNLNKMADNGEILRFEVGKELHFDADTSYHQHCVCKKCRTIQDVFQPEISRYALKKIDLKMFIPDNVNIIYTGICKQCS